MPAALILAGVLAVGCGSDDAGSTDPDPTDEAAASEDAGAEESGTEASLELISTHDAWVRMPAAGQTVAAAYVTFVNGGEADVRLLSVSSELATTELHETLADDDGVMRMQERTEGFVIPAGGELVMAPGGVHVMLLGIDPLDLAMLDEVEFAFEFEGLGSMMVTAEVRRDMAMPDGHMGGMHGDEDHEGAHEAMHGDGAHEGAQEAMDGSDGHAGMFGDAELDVDALHALDDELHAGVFEPERQRIVVAAALASLEHTELPAAFDIEAFVDVLTQLDAALEAGDLDAAKALAFQVHDIAHDLVPHSH